MVKFIGGVALCLAACATAPKTTSGREDLVTSANATLQEMQNQDASLSDFLSRSEGYVVFPAIGKGGFVVGAAYGRGVLFEHGQFAGYVELNQASVGAQVGAQSFSELVVLESRDSLERLKLGTYSLGGDINVVALTTGAAAAADFRQGIAVFVRPNGGIMAGVTVTGQKLNFNRG
jgi:lipid-binding SYLF domain-containing protein